MKTKIVVYGKSQNRTALGIAQAWLKMNPKANIEDLRNAFPDNLAPDSGVKKNFILEDESRGPGNWDGYMTSDSDWLTTGKGTKIAIIKMWTKPSLERLIKKADEYGISASQNPEETKAEPNGYKIICINGYSLPKAHGCLGLFSLLFTITTSAIFYFFS